jgi:hypothetical protein
MHNLASGSNVVVVVVVDVVDKGRVGLLLLDCESAPAYNY